MNPLTAIKTSVKILTGASRREYNEACLKSIREEQDQINAQGHA